MPLPMPRLPPMTTALRPSKLNSGSVKGFHSKCPWERRAAHPPLEGRRKGCVSALACDRRLPESKRLAKQPRAGDGRPIASWTWRTRPHYIADWANGREDVSMAWRGFAALGTGPR